MKLEETETPPVRNKINQPREHEAKICVWADLSVNDIDEVYNAWNSAKTVKEMLTNMFQIDQDEQAPILLDLYYYTLQFAKENTFNSEQTSAFFSIVKRTHEICIETPFDNFDICFKHFKEQLLCHAVKRPPHSLALYDAEQIKTISEYVINTYFRHYKMYKYAFTPTVRLDLTVKYSGMPDSPASSEAGDALTDEQTLTDGQATEGIEQEDTSKPIEVVETVATEESESAGQLRAMIKHHLQEEITKLRESMEQQLKTTEETLAQKLNAAEEGKRSASKRGKGSAKSNKKK